MSTIILYAIPAFLLTMFIEWRWSVRERRELWNGAAAAGYERRDTLASIAMGLGNVGIAAVVKTATVGLWIVLSRFAPFHLPNAWWTWVLLFFADDLAYYAFHRTSHEVRLLWAAHVNHHSSQRYNLSTAVRQSWTTPFTMIPFWLALPLLREGRRPR
jgi:sterol desaturase/sphingolipid hydroxylase (fatty acid hydroxylase superfamily)